MSLIICTDENARVPVEPDDAPELFEAWDAWVASRRGSSAELHMWTRVIDAASEYLGTTEDHFGEAAEDVISS